MKRLEPSPARRRQLWRDALEELRTEWPAPYPVRVQRRQLRDSWGTCQLLEKPKRFVITIDPRAQFSFQLMILAHEWAHALDWESTQEHGTDHGDTWGLWQARAYRAISSD